MRINDLISASNNEYDYIRNKLEALPENRALIFDNTELPQGSVPATASVSFCKRNGKFAVVLSESIDYSGNNPVFKNLCEQHYKSFADWEQFKLYCKSLSDAKKSDDFSLNEVTDWDSISVNEQEAAPISFETLQTELKKTVIGQDFAVDTITYQISLFLKKKNSKKPLSFLLYGTPGTGKSETAKNVGKILANALPHSFDTVWTDLNTFTEAHSVYRLIGSPPGYVGYEDTPVFEAVTNNPYTVFIFDELDKAHPQVLKTFMAILDEGRCASRKELEDNKREFDFKNCIFFFTSNYNLNQSNNTVKRKLGFDINSTIENISYDENAVNVQYADISEADNNETLPQRIYRETEKARQNFVKAGVLREIASRFGGFVEFKPLDETAKIKILAKQVIDTGFEYGVRIGYISPSIMQELANAATSENSLTVRSFRAVIDGYLSDSFAQTAAEANSLKAVFKLDGSLLLPVLIPII